MTIIASNASKQVIAFATFIGYSERQMENYVRSFFDSGNWKILGPSKISEDKLYLLLATIVGR